MSSPLASLASWSSFFSLWDSHPLPKTSEMQKVYILCTRSGRNRGRSGGIWILSASSTFQTGVSFRVCIPLPSPNENPLSPWYSVLIFGGGLNCFSNNLFQKKLKGNKVYPAFSKQKDSIFLHPSIFGRDDLDRENNWPRTRFRLEPSFGGGYNLPSGFLLLHKP